MNKDEALKLALEWMEAIVNSNWRNWEELASPEEFERWVKSRANHSAVALRQALEQQDMGIDRGAWSDVPDATKWVDALRGDEESEQEPEAWTLTEFLDKRETTTNAPLWFVDPVNSAWTPLYTAPPSKPDVNQEMLDALTQWANAEASNDQIELENARTSRDAALAKHKEQA